MNEAHLAWRKALAQSVGTTPDRVAVHCVHQHNAPFVCFRADAAARQNPDLPQMFDRAFFDGCLERARQIVSQAISEIKPLTHVAHGQAEVRQVASNRRVYRDQNGKVLNMRGSSCQDPHLISLPEGLIDPALQTIALYSGATKVAALHYYATHPMSFYRDGRVTSDFCGLARKRRQHDEPACTHIYLTGCAGNIAAGKYNDGSTEARHVLTRRVYQGIVESEARLTPAPLNRVDWRTEAVLPVPAIAPDLATAQSILSDPARSQVERMLAACRIGWLQRYASGLPFILSCLKLNDISIVHLPGEMFVEYQLRARAMRPGRPVAVAGYGDDGLWYVPTREEYAHNGYEVSVAFCGEGVDLIMTGAIHRLLS
jgi:hypothetical protein